MTESTDDIAEYLFAHRARALPPAALAEALDRLIWVLDDNGASIHNAQRRWLRGDDEAKVEVALMMDEVFPFADRDEMASILSSVAARWPRLAPLCKEVIEQWDAQLRLRST